MSWIDDEEEVKRERERERGGKRVLYGKRKSEMFPMGRSKGKSTKSLRERNAKPSYRICICILLSVRATRRTADLRQHGYDTEESCSRMVMMMMIIIEVICNEYD